MMNYNPNIASSAIFVNELVNLGVKYVCIGAGSRSTPLILTTSAHPKLTCYSHIDERSGAYFALGLAKVSGTPVILISTSGTAAVNFHPAITEAFESNIPLIVVTADRPHELRGTGANQTTDQTELFSTHINWFIDIDAPDQHWPEKIKQMQEIAFKAFNFSITPFGGPIHVNFQFRKPLEPTADENKELNPYHIVKSIELKLENLINNVVPQNFNESILTYFKRILEKSKKIMIIVGPQISTLEDRKNIMELAIKTNGLLFLDGISGLRHDKTFNELGNQIICSYETFFNENFYGNLPDPDIIIQLGKAPVSKNLVSYIDSKTNVIKIKIGPNLTMKFGRNKNNIQIRGELKSLVGFIDHIKGEKEWKKPWGDTEEKTWSIINSFLDENPKFEAYIIREVIKSIPEKSNIFVANSLPVRYMDQFVDQKSKSELTIFTNRGVSGIDGNISTALGIASHSNLPTYLIIGDLAFYHDLTGLMSILRYNLKLKILIINNHGGAIFDRLPISQFFNSFDEFFATKHSLSFDKISEQFNIAYLKITTDSLEEGISFLHDKNSCILEYSTEYSQIENFHKILMKKFKESMKN